MPGAANGFLKFEEVEHASSDHGVGHVEQRDLHVALVRERLDHAGKHGIHGRDSAMAAALGGDFKGVISVVIYAVAIGLAFVSEWMALALYVAVALMWFVPDRRFERRAAGEGSEK